MSLPEVTWTGYLRADGRKGIRNKVLVMYTVECAHFVASQVVRKVDDPDIELIGFTGCTDNEYAIRMMIAMIRHPNVGGVMVIGLGCEYTQPEWLAQISQEAGKPASWFFIQQAGGTAKSIARAVEEVQEIRGRVAESPRVPMTWSDLVVGGECGGSDYTSGLAGNAVVGHFYDELVDAGGTAIFEEIVEAIGVGDSLVARAIDAQARDEVSYTYAKALAYCRAVRQFSVSPGNFAGGLSTIEEKSMGAVVKSGTRPIQGVLKVAERPRRNGLWLLDSTPDPHFMQFGITNPNDTEGLMDLISCGAQIVLFTTGRGSVVGSAVAPSLKITGNYGTYLRMQDDMDFNAGRVLTGEMSQAELAEDLATTVLRVAQGGHTHSEALGHKEYLIPYKFQEPRVAFTNCGLMENTTFVPAAPVSVSIGRAPLGVPAPATIRGSRRTEAPELVTQMRTASTVQKESDDD